MIWLVTFEHGKSCDTISFVKLISLTEVRTGSPLQEEIVKINVINTEEQILKMWSLRLHILHILHILLNLDVLCLLLTSSLRDSDPGYLVLIQVNKNIFQAELATSPGGHRR